MRSLLIATALLWLAFTPAPAPAAEPRGAMSFF